MGKVRLLPFRNELDHDEQMLALAVGGEQAVARVRLVFVAGLFAVAILYFAIVQTLGPELVIGVVTATVALLLGVVYYLLSRHARFHAWLSYVTSVSDVTLVTAALFALLSLGTPHATTIGNMVWAIYLLAIGLCALRPRRGITKLVTLVAIGEYLAITLYADLRWLPAGQAVPAGYGYFDWMLQVARILLMGAGGMLTVLLVKRASYISHLAGTDSLTGVFNRTYFDLRLVEELQRAARYHHMLTLAFVDIDHFKDINDTFGHHFGDKVLILVSLRLRNGLRASDILFRYGGDELAIVMPETSGHNAHRVLLRIVNDVRTVRLKGRPLGVSVGIATWPYDARTKTGLVQVADENLYAAKSGGRNRIVGNAPSASRRRRQRRRRTAENRARTTQSQESVTDTWSHDA